MRYFSVFVFMNHKRQKRSFRSTFFSEDYSEKYLTRRNASFEKCFLFKKFKQHRNFAVIFSHILFHGSPHLELLLLSSAKFLCGALLTKVAIFIDKFMPTLLSKENILVFLESWCKDVKMTSRMSLNTTL